MPLNVPDKLPAIDVLKEENIFVMTESRATSQDIRPLRIAILNLMPLKINTENHILRALSNTPLQVEIELLQTASYTSTHTPAEHLGAFYKTWEEVKTEKFDGMIITGAPVEHLEFEEVAYWDEMTAIMDWTRTHVTSTLHICWASQAGLYHHFGVPKRPLPRKMFGVFHHQILERKDPIVRGFDDDFLAPHSRHTDISKEDVAKVPELSLVAASPEAGVYVVTEKSGKGVYVTGHSEYDPLTLKEEYDRDVRKGLQIDVPRNYFPEDDPLRQPVVRWRGHASLLYGNWLNYYVYQVTPYRIEEIH